MTSITVFLRRLGNLLRLLFRRKTLQFAYGSLVKLAVYFERLLSRARSRRSSTSRSPTISDKPRPSDEHAQFLSSTVTDTVICTSQVPPNISILPESPIRTMSEARTRPSPLISMRPNSEYLHPNSNFSGHDNGLVRPYAHSEPAMSIHSISSRAPSHRSIRSRDSKESHLPSPTRSIRHSHVSTGITTPARTSVTLPAGEVVPQSSVPHDIVPSIITSSTETPTVENRTMHPILSIDRYDRNVVMFVLKWILA